MNRDSAHRRVSSVVGAVVMCLALALTGCADGGDPTGSQNAQSTTTATSSPTSPAPSSPATSPTAAPSAAEPKPAAKPPAPTVVGPTMAPSDPDRLQIPEIGVDTELLDLPRAENGNITVPPTDDGSPAGWYDQSPTPGSLGPSIILGHVNTTTNPEGVFFRLHELTPGQQFSVIRADGSRATFAVDRLQRVQKAAFPTIEVYGNTDRAEIRLITCDGYNPETGEWDDNMIVYGHLVATK